jgi:hypothetical protein
MHDSLLVLHAIAKDRGINPTTIPGMGQPPIRRSTSPSIQSASSPGVSMENLTLSESRSRISSSSSLSDVPQPSGESAHTSNAPISFCHSAGAPHLKWAWARRSLRVRELPNVVYRADLMWGLILCNDKMYNVVESPTSPFNWRRNLSISGM